MLSKWRSLRFPNIDDETAAKARAEWSGTVRLIARGLACWVASQELQARAMEILMRDTGLARHLGLVPPEETAAAEASVAAAVDDAQLSEAYRTGYDVGAQNGTVAAWIEACRQHERPVPEWVPLEVRRLDYRGEWFGPKYLRDEGPTVGVDERQDDEHDQGDERAG